MWSNGRTSSRHSIPSWSSGSPVARNQTWAKDGSDRHVSRGEVISINNYYRLFKSLLTPVQLDGLRLLLTPFPQEEFNPTDDRKTLEPSLGVTCLDCHVNGHTTAQAGEAGFGRVHASTMRVRGTATKFFDPDVPWGFHKPIAVPDFN
jgi:hypothetical protein